MYARYIPPSKKSSAPQPAAPAAAPTPEPSPRSAPTPPAAPQEVGGAGFTYSRYIPGSKPAAKPVTSSGIQYFDDEPDPSPSQSKRKREVEDEARRNSPKPEIKKSKKSKTENESNGAEGSKSEKSKKSSSKEDKKSKKQNAAELAIAKAEVAAHEVTEHATGKDADDSSDDDKKRKKKRKEEKRKKKLKEAEDYSLPDGDQNDDPDVSMNDAADPDERQPDEPTQSVDVAKKEKKRKKEKSKKKADEEEEEPDTVDERHKIMLDRKTKSLKLASEAPREEQAEEEEQPEEIHDLEPLPQPKLVSEETPVPAYETLPTWLAAPIRVSQSTRTPFTELGILPKASRTLEERGFLDAFAVQTAAIPLLLPTSKERPGDLLISAATGSGKTLAYALPIVRDLSQGVVTRLRALVVLPTRELVKQAQEVFELCAKVYEGGNRKRVRVGVAIGSQTLRSEQESLIECESRYEPEAYRKIQEQRRSTEAANPLLNPGFENSDPRLGAWEGQVNDFFSTVDVLLCTPGRLVEHIEQTRGFDLDYVRWLVVDEADKLLAQSFQGWLDVVLERFKTRKFTAREFPDMDLEGVRKVVLSATLTRDLTLLNQLDLSRPRLIVLEGDSSAGTQVAEHTLPGLLEEFAIRVRDTALKPLYLLELLKGGYMKDRGENIQQPGAPQEDVSPDSDSTSDSSSDSDSTSDSDSDSNSSSEADTKANKPSKPESTLPIALIFTKSNESALRLSRLLTLLDESLTPHISTLTSTTPTHIRRKTLRAFTTPSSPIRLIIASDLVARGIDLSKLDHVINYDLPPSAAAYVHRVGRTARAGRRGSAWTLVGDDESGWFWGKIAKGSLIRRAQKVGRTMIEDMDDEKVASYEAALAKLGQEAMDTRKKR